MLLTFSQSRFIAQRAVAIVNKIKFAKFVDGIQNKDKFLELTVD